MSTPDDPADPDRSQIAGQHAVAGRQGVQDRLVVAQVAHGPDDPAEFARVHPVRQAALVLWAFARLAPFPDFNLMFGFLTMNAFLLATVSALLFFLSILLHELGHLVGLDHVDDWTELMHGGGEPNIIDFGPGDLTGLARLGQGECVPAL